MDPAYVTWIGVAVFGAVLGLFVRPKTVVVGAVALFVIAIVGLIAAAFAGAESMTWMFGIAGMALPVLGAVAAVGSVLGRAVREKLSASKAPE